MMRISQLGMMITVLLFSSTTYAQTAATGQCEQNFVICLRTKVCEPTDKKKYMATCFANGMPPDSVVAPSANTNSNGIVLSGQSPLGRWQMPMQHVWMNITNEGSVYLVQVTCDACAFPGAYVGPYKNNILMINSAFGVIVYNPSDDTIMFAGTKLLRER